MNSLTEQEKAELLEDANDSGRREDFRRLKKRPGSMSLEQWLEFMSDMTNLLPPGKKKLIKGDDFRL